MDNQVKLRIKSKNENSIVHKYYAKSILAVFLFILLIIVEIRYSGWYIDEIIGLSSAFYLIFFRRKIERRDIITLIIISVVAIIGLISNILFEVSSSIFSICVDIIAETKLILAYFAMKYFLSDEEKKAVIDMLVSLAKLFILSSFVCGIISIFVNIGMTSSERYGLPSFKFIFPFSFQYVAVYILVFGVLVCNTKMSDRKRKIYYVMAIISLLLATKGPPIMFSIIFVGLALTFKKYQRIPPIIIILGIIVLIWAGSYQLETYLFNENAPRHIFFKYAFKTANHYFPLGSGFGTFGSDQAARNYSQLYYQYGFHKINGMRPDDPAFLSDNFWPMAIGQFGWIGSILYLSAYILVFLTFSNKKFNNERKAFLYAAYLQYIIHAIGSAILSSSAGMIGFMAIAIFTVSQDDESKIKSRIKINIK